MKTFKCISSDVLLCLIFCSLNIFAQEYPVSAGPAPFVYNNNQQSPIFDAMIGTRYFTQVSSSPTFQFGKAFMESCTITNIGAAVPISFPGGLFYRNGVVYSWNQSAPYQLWSNDTVSGVTTLLYNMTGVPMANLTGMCWDGTNMYGLCTSLSASQLLQFNINTGMWTPIGTPSAACAGGITLLGRLGTASNLYVLDIVADNSYKVNKTTGVFTLLAPLGININFGQDGSVDPNDKPIYVACYSTVPEVSKFVTETGVLVPDLCI